MEAGTATETGKRAPRGRKDKSGQEAAIKLGPLKDRIDDLVRLYRTHADTGVQLSEGIKAVAEKSGLLSPVVRKYVQAKAGDDFQEEKTKVEQLALVFDVE